MAFSKAKICRFNDVTTCAPAPGAYNPKYDDHVPGVKYTKDSKPQDPQSPASSTSDGRSISSAKSISNFRTPNIPRRRKMSNSAGKKNQFMSPQKSEALREKIVECFNKDESIKDLESQLEELKLAISKLNVQKNYLTTERDEAIEQLKQVQDQLESINKQLTQKDLENKNITDDFFKMKDELKAEKDAEMKKLQENLNLLEERLKINLQENSTVLSETEEKLAETKVAHSHLETEFFELREKFFELEVKYEESLKSQADLQNNHTIEMETLKRLHDSKINQLEFEMTDVVSNWKEIVEQTERDNVIKINNLEMEHMIELEKLKEDVKLDNIELSKNCKEFKSEIEKINFELNKTMNKLQEEINQHEIDKTAALAEKHCYEITLNKTYDTVNALKNRLLNSDRDVEQLNKELENLEQSAYETEQKHIQENAKLKKLNEELKSDNRESLVALLGQIRSIEDDVSSKIDNLKSTADFQISKLKAINDKLFKDLERLHSFGQSQQTIHNHAYLLVTDARKEIEQLESEATNYKLKIFNLEAALQESQDGENKEVMKNTIRELKDKLKERDLEMNELASIYKKYIEKSRQYDDLQQKYEKLLQRNEELEIENQSCKKTIAAQDALIGPFREQLEKYESECQLLLEHKSNAEKEAKEMGLKYAEILGHQNCKQKLKHMVDLKKKNMDLMECKQNYEAKMIQLNRTIEKQKQKILQMNKSKTIDKENVGSPVRMPNILSPVALKERN